MPDDAPTPFLIPEAPTGIAEGGGVMGWRSHTGPGLEPERVSCAFDPSFPTRPPGEDTAFGLPMVWRFSGQSGGPVRLHSPVGNGTADCIYLPVRSGCDGAEPAVEARPAAPRAEPGDTILVVEDEPILRMLTVEMLQELGYRTFEAPDAGSALHRIVASGRIDLLLTDVGLPGGMDGRQLAHAARGQRPGLKILFITGFTDSVTLDGGEIEPGMEILAKPFGMDALSSRIKAMIGGCQAMPQHRQGTALPD